jgi:hypothetical protein
MILKKILSSFIVEEKNSIFKNNIDLFRTLNAFQFKNKKNLYLNEKQEVESRMRNIITFMLERIKSRIRDIVISLKEIEFRNVEMLLYFLKNQLLTKVDFQMLAIELIIVKMMILEQSKKRKTLLQRRKFDIINRVYLVKNFIYEKLLCFYRWNLLFLFFCVRAIFHHFVINIRVHSKFYREVDKIVKSSIWW